MTVLALPVLGITLWHFGSTRSWFNAYLLPPPVEIWTTAVDLWGRGGLAEHIEVSLMRVLVGFALSGSSALLLAALNYRFPLIRRMTFLPLEAIRVIPPLALVPLLIPWFGIGMAQTLNLNKLETVRFVLVPVECPSLQCLLLAV
ncbi:hypothetical protein [uncultured Cohaesibacter sp.]|uniref:ABC transporter permease n=2 Tax=uncultured Cohaesibacter sp. TaxID=1002546 RepID=UPI0029C80CBD|nr:hypothetical protein [uncultured Cohaesibacter sp.]